MPAFSKGSEAVQLCPKQKEHCGFLNRKQCWKNLAPCRWVLRSRRKKTLTAQIANIFPP
jgi:hypothetical protein